MKGIERITLLGENWSRLIVRWQISRSRGHKSAWFPLLSACRLVEFDTSIICHVLVYSFGSFLLQDMFSSLQVFAFWGPKYDRVYGECAVNLHSKLCRRARLLLELFAGTVDRFLSRVSYLPSDPTFSTEVS